MGPKWALGLLVVAGCFAPPTRECRVMCGAGGLCPDDFVCLSDGYCHESPSEALCGEGAAPGVDAAVSAGADASTPAADAAASGADASPHVAASLTAAADTHVWEERIDRNFGDAESLGADGGSFSGNHVVTLIRFDLSSIPPGSPLEGSPPTFVIFTTDNRLDQGSASLYQVLEGWSEGTGNDTDGAANWSERSPGQGWASPGVGEGSRAAAALAVFTPDANETAYPIELPPALVQGWIDDPASNHGLSVQVPAGEGYGVSFHSRTSPQSGRRPRLDLNYCRGCP